MTNEELCLPAEYKSRDKPEPYPDNDDGVVWQPGAYRELEMIAEQWPGENDGRPATIVDIGCGQARKLLAYNHQRFEVIGYDTPDNVAWLKKNRSWIDSRPVDLEFSPVFDVPEHSLIICSDVVEHLVDPTWLIRELARQVNRGCKLVVSTPDRVLTHGPNHLGPPPNPAHVREWCLPEFMRFCDAQGLSGGEWKYTRTTDVSDDCFTITGVFR